jgi:dipeptidase E
VSTIIAIGGDEIGTLREDGSLKPVLADSVHREIIFRTGKKHPKILYIPTAKDDSEEYIVAFQKYYNSLGCAEIDVLRLIKERPSKKDIESKILSADVIYVNGGDTFRMIEIWKKHGIDKLLKRALHRGVIMTGHSAGAICWFTYGDSDSFGKEDDFRVTALGFVNALFCPHYDTDAFRRIGLREIMKKTPHLVALALDECAAIEIVDDNYRILTATPECRARRTYWMNGEYIIEEIEPSEDFQNLNTLLTKPLKSFSVNNELQKSQLESSDLNISEMV